MYKMKMKKDNATIWNKFNRNINNDLKWTGTNGNRAEMIKVFICYSFEITFEKESL